MAQLRKIAGSALTLALVATYATGIHADTLHLTDGKKINGLIIKAKSNGGQVTIKSSSGEIAIPRTKISRVEETSSGVSYGLLGDDYLQAGNFEKAIESYQAGLDLEPGNLDLQQKFNQAKSGISNQSAQVQAASEDRTRRVMDQALKLAQAGNFDSAYNTLVSIQPSELSPIYPEYKKTLADIYLMWGTNLLDRQNTGGAAQKLNEVLKLDPANAQAKSLLVKTFEGDPTKLEQSATFYLQSQVPEEQLKGAEALFKMQKYGEAVPVFEKYMNDAALNRQFSITQRLGTALDTLHNQAASKGDYRTALAYFARYAQIKPDADPSPYTKYLFMIKRAETDMNNPDSRYELALFAEQLGLIPTAKEEYRNILAMDPQSTGPLAALKRFADSDVADARDYLSRGEYVLASNMAQNIAGEYPMYPELIAQANQIQAQAQVEAQKVAQNAKAEARALAERGDNYYQQAMQFIGAYVSTETDATKRIFSPRNEAAKYMGQALFAWKTALQMDPTLGDPTTYNLTFKIQDATNKYQAIANRRAPNIPRPYSNSSQNLNG